VGSARVANSGQAAVPLTDRAVRRCPSHRASPRHRQPQGAAVTADAQ